MFTPDEVLRTILKTYTGIFAKAEIHGSFPLPQGPKIIAANHTLASDALQIPLVLDEKVYFLIQANLFQIPLAGSLLKQSGQIPVPCENARSTAVLEQACHALAEGKTLCIFPEGQLVPPGKRIRARTGIMHIARRTGVPIIPLGIYVPPQNMLKVNTSWLGQKRTGLWQISGKCHLNFGAPRKLFATKSDPTNIRVMTEELMKDIYSLVSETEKELTCVSHTSLNPILP